MADISDEDLIALAQKHGVSVPSPDKSGPADDELVQLARKNGLGPDGNPIPQKSFKDVDWVQALKDEAMAPFTGLRAGQPIPDSALAGTKSMGLIAGAAAPTAARAAGLIEKAREAAKVVKDNAVPLYVARGIYHDIKGLLGGGNH